MSKVSDAKLAQGYSTERLNCGNCKHMTSEMVQPTWSTNPAYAREKNLRCGIGKFAIKKTAICGKHESKS